MTIATANGSAPYEVAAKYAAATLSVLPIRTDGTKAPPGPWAAFIEHIPTPQELNRLFRGRLVGVGIIGGEVSGHLEIIDIDETELVDPYLALVESTAPGLVGRLTKVRTPRPNLHLYYRCPEVKIPGNQELANSEPRPDFNKDTGEPVIDPNTGKQKLKSVKLIETRGEGGYCVAPGSPAACHREKRLYEHVGGPPLTEVPTITADEREILFDCARSFDLLLVEPRQPPAESSNDHLPGQRPGDDFAERASWDQILTPHGWTSGYVSGGLTYWTRPGKAKARGGSATTGIRPNGADLLVVFSSNASPFKSRPVRTMKASTNSVRSRS